MRPHLDARAQQNSRISLSRPPRLSWVFRSLLKISVISKIFPISLFKIIFSALSGLRLLNNQLFVVFPSLERRGLRGGSSIAPPQPLLKEEGKYRSQDYVTSITAINPHPR